MVKHCVKGANLCFKVATLWKDDRVTNFHADLRHVGWSQFHTPVPSEKYDATADVAIALAKYQAGLPFHRLARVQAGFGIPLPESVQFARCEAVADAALPVFLHLRQLAAQAELLYADDGYFPTNVINVS